MNQKIKRIVLGLVAITLITVLCGPSVRAEKQETGNRQKRASNGKKKTWLVDNVEHVDLYPEPGSSAPAGFKRNALVFRKPGAKATVLICHGFMCSKTDVRFLHYLFKQFHVVFFDFRAHGDDPEGQTCTFGLDESYDVRAAVDFIRKDPELSRVPLVSYAFSMGAVASIHAQSRYKNLFDCAIWDCPFESTEGLLLRIIDRLEVQVYGYAFQIPGRAFLKKYAYNSYVQSFLKKALKAIAQVDSSLVETRMTPINTVKAAEGVSIPTLLITCVNDLKAPPAAVQKIFDALQGSKILRVTGGRGHFDSFFSDPQSYELWMGQFIEQFLSGTFNAEKPVRLIEEILAKGGVGDE
ncbi:MAG: alpha/beta fold hydrolase [Candidatus Babeliaceae bacterium]|nr:alpha/beta fold hydrolase [Candidatus Babeliaceae bacterium]